MAAVVSGMSTSRRPTWPGRLRRLLALAVLAAVDVFVIRSIGGFFGEGTWFLGVAVILLMVGINAVVLLRRRLMAWRWLAPGLSALLLMTVAPIVYTVYVAASNYDANHLLTQNQAVEALERQTFLPEDAPEYRWAAYESADGDYALWLVPPTGASLLIEPGQAAQEATPGSGGVGVEDAEGFPTTIEGYERLDRVETVANLTALTGETFGTGEDGVVIASLDQAARFEQRYVADDSGVVTDQQTGTTYEAVEGTFTSADGQVLSPSFQAFVGLDNVQRVFADSDIRGAVLDIFLWTVAFAVIVVGVQFFIGLAIALVLNDPALPRRVAKAVRSVLLLPYVVPTYLTILVWGALLNQNRGVIPLALERYLSIDPGWVDDPTGAKVAVLMVAFWLGFPYFLLITSGALQAIPADLLEAAMVDGAGAWRRFREVVFPLLLQMVSPLIVLGLAFNFNNFLVVYLLKGGGPQMADAPPPAGDTDLLISYTYKLSFDFGRNDYALAAVITMFIFAVLVPVVVSQFRYYQVWSEEN